jgi:hypothetical protein
MEKKLDEVDNFSQEVLIIFLTLASDYDLFIGNV